MPDCRPASLGGGLAGSSVGAEGGAVESAEAFYAGFAGAVGLVANPIVLLSLYHVASTGARLPGGPASRPRKARPAASLHWRWNHVTTGALPACRLTTKESMSARQRVMSSGGSRRIGGTLRAKTARTHTA